MNLASLKKGQLAKISRVESGNSSLRLMELGFVMNATIELVSIAPTGDPLAFSLGDSVVSLRKKDAALVQIDILTSHQTTFIAKKR